MMEPIHPIKDQEGHRGLVVRCPHCWEHWRVIEELVEHLIATDELSAEDAVGDVGIEMSAALCGGSYRLSDNFGLILWHWWQSKDGPDSAGINFCLARLGFLLTQKPNYLT